MRHVVVLGAGYGGLLTALKLEKKTRSLKDVQVTLVDRNGYHQYLHLSYQLVTGLKRMSDLTISMAELLNGKKVNFLQAIVDRIDLANRVVRTDKGDLPYDVLVTALGSEPNYYHIKGAEKNAFCVCSVETATLIGDKLRRLLAEQRGEEVKVVVGGGGFTGVELAGEIVEELRCCVIIVEAGETLLQSWKIPAFSVKVANTLTSMGAEIFVGQYIAEVKPNMVILKDGRELECSFFVWAGGVQSSQVLRESEFKTEKSGRAIINEFCEAAGIPNVYVVGDCALVADSKIGEVLPQCIEVALQQADVVAKNVYADVIGGKRTVFIPKFSGLILTVGKKYAIGKVYGLKVEGWLARVLKRLIHLHYVYQIDGFKRVLKEVFG